MWARIDGGGPENVVPDLAIIRFNVRLKEGDDASWFEDTLHTLIHDANEQDGIDDNIAWRCFEAAKTHVARKLGSLLSSFAGHWFAAWVGYSMEADRRLL